MEKMNKKQALGFAGAFIAFMIGSGFATGQEVMQYFAAYGYYGVLGGIVAGFLLLYASVSYMSVGYKEKFAKSSEIFTYYCGKKLGKVFDWFTVLSIYMCFAVMLSGAGATINQHYDVPIWIGTILICVLASITVMMGLGKIVDVIGKIGPAIIVISVVLSVISIVRGFPNLSTVATVIPTLDLMAASTNWLFAALAYSGICILWLASFLTALGGQADSLREAKWGARGGVMAFCGAVILATLGILANIESVAGTMVPNLVLADNVSSVLAMFFSVIIVAGIFTTAVQLLWTVVARITAEGTAKFKGMTVLLSLSGLSIGLIFPFDTLINIIYVAIGYGGFILFIFIVIRQLRDYRQRLAIKENLPLETND